MTLNLKAKIYTDEEAARRHLEKIQWPDGPICPHCGCTGSITKLEGKSTRPGVYKCNDCEKPFSVTVGTVFERSKIPLTKWLLATELLTSSKKGISSHQIHRMLGVTYKTAWFMTMRIREAMKPDAGTGPLGGFGKVVEADTTWIGGKEQNKHRNKRGTGMADKMAQKQVVHTLIERGGRARSDHVANVSGKTLRPVVMKQVHRTSTLMTDEGGEYRNIGREFHYHGKVNHSAGEYVRGDVHSNSVESYFATLKRGIVGTYHHVSEAHLKRYLAEFDFRYSERASLGVDDDARMSAALQGARGKRLTYRRPDETAHA